ncbi:MAG: Lrp/AsnC ligand binding domain-containing protein [Candidatus Hodarchaeales archaeon]
MIKAYMLMTVKGSASRRVVTEAKKIDEITSISAVTGIHDIIAVVRVEKIEDLFDITNRIHDIDGIINTETAVVTKEL